MKTPFFGEITIQRDDNFVRITTLYDFWPMFFRDTIPLKGASPQIEIGCIWYQKKDLEKLEVRGWFRVLTDARAQSYWQITRFSAPFLHYNLFETIPNAAERCLHKNH